MNRVTPETIAATNAARVAYFDGLQEKPLNNYTTESIAPEEMKVGDYMLMHDVVYEVSEIRVYNHKTGIPHVDKTNDIPVYVTIGKYVAGNLQTYKWFLHDDQNGCAKSHFTSDQGNARAGWHRVTFNIEGESK
jgi:hypothetical protein